MDADGFDLEVEIGIKAHSLRFDVASFDIGYATRIGEKKLRPLRDGIRIATQIGSLMLLFRPVVTFVVPGVLVTTVALVLSLVLARGPVVSGHWGFDYNSLIVATAGILGGFQFLMFGVAAAVYSAERGRPTGRLLPALRSWPLRGSMGMIGASVAIFGGVESARLSFGWLGTGGGPFLATRELVVATAAGIFGLQLLSASLFVSLLARRLPYARPGVGKVLQWGGTAKATDKPKKTP
ncbi:MAG: hypothetical protein JW395_4062 [Nitrospira sp.]|nr:hypothetical protein [Nitrospira sp.]